MELLDRYLNSVRHWLPRNQSDDILAEISEDIRSQIEEAENAQGRTLDENEMVAILIRRGHPAVVAGRYLPRRQLIGPTVFPHWLFLLKLVVCWILVPIFVFRLVLTPDAIDFALFFRTLGEFITAVWVTFGVVTLIFAILENSPAKALFNAPAVWDPRHLPVHIAPSPFTRETPIVVSGVFWAAAWIWFVRFHPAFRFGRSEVFVTPVLASFFWPFLLTVLASSLLGLIALFQKTPARPLAGIRLAVDGAGLVVLFLMLRAGALFESGGSGSRIHEIGEAARGLNSGVRVTLIIIALFVVAHVFLQVTRTFRGRFQKARIHPPATNGQTAW